MRRKILAITGTRSDYGLMRPVYQAIHEETSLELHLLVTGMNFLPQYSQALSEIRTDNFGTLHELPVFDPISTPYTMASTFSDHIKGYLPIIQKCQPNIILLQGDRGEMLAAAIAGAHLNIPLVHMSGGDFSGSIDDSIRHAITKFSHFHLPTCAQSHQSLLDMGEEEARIQTVGEPALDKIKNFTPENKHILGARYKIDFSKPVILVAQHSVTTEYEESEKQIIETLEAILALNYKTLLTGPNSDSGGCSIMKVIERYVKTNPQQLSFSAHLGQQDFFSMLCHAAVLVGNSSAGILEAASFKIPVVNIGTRQHGRMKACNVIDTGYNRQEILHAIKKSIENQAFLKTVSLCVNPYGNGDTAPKTVKILKSLSLDSSLVMKWIKGFSPL